LERLEEEGEGSDETILRWRGEGEAMEGGDEDEEEGVDVVALQGLVAEQDEFERYTHSVYRLLQRCSTGGGGGVLHEKCVRQSE